MNSYISTSESSYASGFKPRSIGLQLSGILIGIFVLLAVAEITLRLLPVPQGIYRDHPQTPLASARLVANRDYTWSLGWYLRQVVHGRTNSLGFAAPYEFTTDTPAVALFGDSYVEAIMLNYAESLAGRIDGHFHDQIPTFNFGISGAGLPHYLGLARETSAQFQFSAAIVVITSFDYIEGLLGQEGLYKWSENPDKDLVSLVPVTKRSKLLELARNFALLRYLRYNLKFTPSTFFAERVRHTSCTPAQLTDIDRNRLGQYVEALPKALRLDPGRIVMVFNTDVDGIYDRVDRIQTHQSSTDCPSVDCLPSTNSENSPQRVA
jgi:hypothetical protein